MAHTAPEGKEQQKSSQLALRDGVWYAGEEPCASYREALKKTLRAVDIALPKPKQRQKKSKRWLRLEQRWWWHGFLVEREAREEAERKARQQTLRERWLEQRKAESA